MAPVPLSILLLVTSSSLLLVSPISATFNIPTWRPKGSSFDWSSGSAPWKLAATFASVSQSSTSDSKHSRTEETKQEVLTHSQSSEWTHGFQDNGKGGLKRLDSTSSQEKSTGRSAKELKASESGESAQRDQKQTWVNGKAVVSTDTGKQSSFSNSGHLANRTEFSSETSSSDNRLAKAALPPPPPPALTACFSGDRARPRHRRPSLVFLVHASARPGSLARLLGFLEAFLFRLSPARVVLIFFNRRVLDVLDYNFGAMSDGAELRRRLAETSRGLHAALADECDLPAAAEVAVRLRHQLDGPCYLVVLTAATGLLVDDRALTEARQAAASARRSFDLLTAAVMGAGGHGDRNDRVGHELEPRAADMLGLFSGGGLMPLEFDGGEVADARSADALGRRVCEASAAGPAIEEPWGLPRHGGWLGR